MKKTVSIISVTLLLVSFQNCAKTSVSFQNTKGMLDSSSFSSDTTLIETKLNTPISFALSHNKTVTGVKLAVKATGSTSLNGEVTVNDSENFQLTYKPRLGFRGKDTATVTVEDSYGNQKNLYIIVNVDNPLSGLEPALAVRGLGCIQCHTNVSSSIITDFGYKNNYFFGVKTAGINWNSGNIYGDHGESYNQVNIPANKSILVPAARLPAAVATATNLTTVSDYVKQKFSLSPHANTKQASVVEKNSIYIGAPTESDIVKAFSLVTNERQKYFKNNGDSVALSGLKDNATFFQNSDTLTCDGDLVLRGPLYLENAKVATLEGCRIHVIGSVFIMGSITYVNTNENRNVQITSTKAIIMGLGSVKKNGAFCEPSSSYALQNASYGDSSLTNRLVTFFTVPGNMVRQTPDPVAFGKTIVDEAALIEKVTGTMYDASCRPEGRSMGYERLLLNAPIIQSRYEGDFSGTIISEFALMSLGRFTFSFDPVFNKVSILPFLDSKTYLSVE